MRFAVTRHWEMCDTVEVEADSPWDAIEAAHAKPLDAVRAAYLPHSINSDSTCDVRLIADRTRQRIITGSSDNSQPLPILRKGFSNCQIWQILPSPSD